MPFEQDEDLRRYEEAEAALDAIAKSRTATAGQRTDARNARDALTRDFVGKAFASVEARTDQFKLFIKQMEEVISELNKDSAVPELQQLQQIVDTGKTLVSGIQRARGGGNA